MEYPVLNWSSRGEQLAPQDTTFISAVSICVLKNLLLAFTNVATMGQRNSSSSLEACLVLFVWSCLADKPWLKVLLADLM